jgi:hypothetical protein
MISAPDALMRKKAFATLKQASIIYTVGFFLSLCFNNCHEYIFDLCLYMSVR